MINARKSFFKFQTKEYTKEGLFDIIDVEECLEKNKQIPKISEEDFIYPKKENKLTIPKKSPNSSIVEKINANKLGIVIEDLTLEYPNGYQVKLVDKFLPIDLIGQGAFSTVISAYDVTEKRKIAIKIIPKKEYKIDVQESLYENETKIQKKLIHPNIVKLYDVLDNEHYLYMFMELMSGGTLRDLIYERFYKTENYLFTDEECSTIMNSIISALDFLHKRNIMHRDIKPGKKIFNNLENILFKNKNDLKSLKVGDFGLAVCDRERENLKCGTLIYMAPEIIKKKSYDFTVDIWAAGFVLFILASGGQHPLYNKEMKNEEYLDKVNKQIVWSFPESFPLY